VVEHFTATRRTFILIKSISRLADAMGTALRWSVFIPASAVSILQKEFPMGIPNSDVALSPYVGNFANKLEVSPSVYQVTPDAAEEFAAKALAYRNAQTALVTARETGVRSEPLRVARDAARADMMPQLRSIYGTIQKNIAISDQAKTEIGVKVPKTSRSRINPPTLRPSLRVLSVYDRTVTIDILDPTVGAKRSRPADATQTLVYFFAGENYSGDPNTWQFAGVATERRFDFTVAGTVPAGTRVWITASYTNGRGIPGPSSVPVSTAVQGSGVVATFTAGSEDQDLKLAA
jgi:hypothetical protein